MSTRPAEPLVAGALAALARGEWEEARERFAQALDEEETPAALEGLGWACWWLDETERSLDLRERAYGLYLAGDDRRAASRVAIALGVDSFDLRGEAVAGGWLRRASRLLGSLPACPEQGWLALWEGHLARYAEQDLARARALARRAGELARTLRLQDLELLASSLEGLILVSEGAVAEGMRRIDEATAAAVAGEIRDLDAVGQACCFLVHACEQVWDHLRAAQWGERMKAFCARWRVESLFALCRTQHAATLLRRGEWPAAEAEIGAAMGMLTAGRSAYAAQGAVLLAELRRRQGRAAEAEALLERAPGLSLTLVCQAAMALDRDDPATALALLGRALRRVRPDNWGGRASALDLRVRAALRQGSLETAREDAATLRTIAAAVSTPPFEAVARAAAGRLALAGGDLAQARELLEDAVDLFGEGGFPYEASQARLDLAAVLARLDLLPLAATEAQAARDSLRRLGAAREEARAAAFLDSLSPAPAAASPAPLTAREREVLRLVAQGLADKQVAARLHLSSHTVHRHVSNILAKLDLSSRTAAVAYAARAGLL
jgi:ATP/maltotriose-dependent transcriptional regulator MalT